MARTTKNGQPVGYPLLGTGGQTAPVLGRLDEGAQAARADVDRARLPIDGHLMTLNVGIPAPVGAALGVAHVMAE